MCFLVCKQLLLSRYQKHFCTGHALLRCLSEKADLSKRYSSKKIREEFISFFLEKNHQYIPSSKVYSAEDPSLLFVNAGMNQFKPIFLGTRKNHAVNRAVNSQRCIRAGGKHNDLDDVGFDRTHHTFFEMLGSWSFGDYFKEDACKFAWTFLTQKLQLPQEKLCVTYFDGSDELKLDADAETKQIWLSLGIPPERILPFGSKYNFWEMGDVGPCGPCTEIHFDTSESIKFDTSMVNVDGSSILEVWNLVFMQYNRLHSQKLENLDTNHVDTGMGLERITAILQNKSSNYDTDLFIPIISKLEEICSCRPYTGRFGDADIDGVDAAYRIVSDHVRMLAAAIADGVYPGTRQRNLIVRQVLRRAVNCGITKLNAPPLFLAQLVPLVVSSLSNAFPELEEKHALVMKVLNNAEEVYRGVIDSGKRAIEKRVLHADKTETKFPVDFARELLFHRGFPKSFLITELEKYGKYFDEDEVERFRMNGSLSKPHRGRHEAINREKMNNSLRSKGYPATVDLSPIAMSEGGFDVSAKVLCILAADGSLIPHYRRRKSSHPEPLYVLFDKSCLLLPPNVFADLGSFSHDDQVFQLQSTVTLGDWILHKAVPLSSDDVHLELKDSDIVSLNVDVEAWLAVLRADTCLRMFTQAVEKYFVEPAILKTVTDQDKFRMEITGVCSADDVLNLQEMTMQMIDDGGSDDFGCEDKKLLNPAEVLSFCINKCRTQAKMKTIFHCLSGPAASAALNNAVDAQAEVSRVMKYLDDVTADVDDVTAQVKEVGILSYKTNSQEMLAPVRDASRAKLQKLTSQLRTKIRRMNKRTNSKEINFS